MTLRLKHLKRLSSFGVGPRDEPCLQRASSAMRSSMPVLEKDPSSLEAVNFDSQCKEELNRIKAAVCELFQTKFDSRLGHQATFERGHLSSLLDDIHAVLLTKAGAFMFDFCQSSLLPTGAQLMLDAIRSGASDLVTSLTAAWQHFYTHVLPALEAMFIYIKNSRLSVRQASLLVFRDVIVLHLEPELGLLLSEMFAEGSVHPALRQMVLVVQSVSECYPPTKQQLQFEELTARIVSPYLGYHGLYRAGNTKPVVPSKELEVAHLRRISVVDPRRLTRPLSVSNSLHMATLNDLFTLSADRFGKRTGSRANLAMEI